MTQHTLVSPKVQVLRGFGRWSVTRHRLCTALVLSAVRWRGSTGVLGLSHWFLLKPGSLPRQQSFYWHLLSFQHASPVTYLFLPTP